MKVGGYKKSVIVNMCYKIQVKLNAKEISKHSIQRKSQRNQVNLAISDRTIYEIPALKQRYSYQLSKQ